MHHRPAYAPVRFLRTRLVLLAGGLALAAPSLSDAAPPQYAAANIGSLAPAQPLPVQVGNSVMLTAELPPCAPAADVTNESVAAAVNGAGSDAGPGQITMPGGTQAAVGAEAARTAASTAPTASTTSTTSSTPATAQTDDPLAAVLGRPDPGLADKPVDLAAAPVASPVQCRSVAADAQDRLPDDLLASSAPSYALEYVPPLPGTPSKVKWARPLGAPKPWFSGIATVGGMEEGDRSLTYRTVDGPSLSLGSQSTYTPAWGSAATIGGFGFSNLAVPADRPVAEGKLGYSSMFGHLDYTDTSATQGGINYGSAAGSSALRYGVTKDWTLEGQAQSARAMSATGLGSIYSIGQWGTLNAGATQSRYDETDSWRYRLGYKVDVWSGITLGYANEQTQAGYNDLSTYSSGPIDTRQSRNTLSAGLPMGSWGTLTGTYYGVRDADGVMAERHFGLSQSMLLAPNVRLALGADRDVITGEYAVNMNLSLPLGR
ncbi:fimbria/pilus outer membrane usher protein [Achromobacter aloeverae]|uniref:Fimbrial protein n=1 Tax=Achromobacter aloeverae TaxID=1750518 RepID=A0A4Q1HCF5_9BURK|nr:fimbrial protein [Achromobacter aloeverae]RXN83274.1 fimbrial protein [Achromobacter aloeverae]